MITNKPRTCFKISLFFLLALILSGCICLKNTVTDDHEINVLKTGEDAFIKGEYNKAASIFKYVEEKSLNESYRKRAEFGLFCIKVVLSEDITALNRNIDSIYRLISDKKDFFVNPGMMIQCMKKLVENSSSNLASGKAESLKLRKTIKKREIKIEKLKNRIKTLRYQIQELQNIDEKLRKIQEKRIKN